MSQTGRFHRYLKRQIGRDDPIGDLAADVQHDPTFPSITQSHQRLSEYLQSRAGSEIVILAFDEAWNEFQSRQRRREGLSRSRRFEIFRRDGYRCRLCGANAADGATLEVDHRHPVSKGGDDSDGNLWTLCFDCNRGKGDRSL